MIREALDWLEFILLSVCWLGAISLFLATLALWFLIFTGAI